MEFKPMPEDFESLSAQVNEAFEQEQVEGYREEKSKSSDFHFEAEPYSQADNREYYKAVYARALSDDLSPHMGKMGMAGLIPEEIEKLSDAAANLRVEMPSLPIIEKMKPRNAAAASLALTSLFIFGPRIWIMIRDAKMVNVTPEKSGFTPENQGEGFTFVNPNGSQNG